MHFAKKKSATWQGLGQLWPLVQTSLRISRWRQRSIKPSTEPPSERRPNCTDRQPMKSAPAETFGETEHLPAAWASSHHDGWIPTVTFQTEREKTKSALMQCLFLKAPTNMRPISRDGNGKTLEVDMTQKYPRYVRHSCPKHVPAWGSNTRPCAIRFIYPAHFYLAYGMPRILT